MESSKRLSPLHRKEKKNPQLLGRTRLPGQRTARLQKKAGSCPLALAAVPRPRRKTGGGRRPLPQGRTDLALNGTPVGKSARP